MLILFVIYFFLWLLSVAYRIVSTIITFAYFADVARAYWGLRYFQEHLVLEIIVVVALGVSVGLTVHYAKNRKQYIASQIGFFVLPVLVLLHLATLDWEIGYQERVMIADDLHVVDWKYSPSVSGRKPGEKTLHIEAILPGFSATYKERPETYLRMNLAKSKDWDSVYSSIFPAASEAPKNSECVEEPYNRYCRIFIDGVWYYAHHQNFDEDKGHLFPSLGEFERELPKLFDSFVK